ncbi:MAG: type I 3-dehydroquinate dehydratase [Verrucomicrobia bacterium]|nr:type I 3-dehydroquinate dehydratase [Verrucomicrobiota bacterium]
MVLKKNPTIGDIKTSIQPPPRRPVAWKNTPLTVGTISTEEGLRNLAHPPAGIDLAEVRLDLLLAKGVEPEKIMEAMSKKEIPVLLTLRTREEGGAFNWRSRQRVLFFLGFLPFADSVDLELTNLPRLGRVLRAIRRSKRDLVLSSHSLKRKLTPLRLKRLLSQFKKTRAHVYKIVGLARRPRDLRALAEPLLTFPHMRLAILASGPLATASRLSLPGLGSRLVYVHLDEPAAPGQPGHDSTFTLAGLRAFLSSKKS